ncbi:MAG: hypothetical protein B6I38_10970 [Anaerolineaceae bacterium 4572_5.1]|nr:MAG: hypothetical protein B6I38_10970 [Anaerolineaceae bacterium 4572_5.1]
MTAFASPPSDTPPADNPAPPNEPVKLIFIHHSCGGNWLADVGQHEYAGGLGQALMNNNYFVSATNYGWGPDGIGDNTDIGHWWDWFRGPNSDTIMAAVYAESGQNVGDFGYWSRLPADPGGENRIIMFKSCYPNSGLFGNPGASPTSGDNPLRGGDAWSDAMTVANAKGIYNDLLVYFAEHPEKLFIVITAPPMIADETDAAQAANARAFNDWLANNWLIEAGYAYNNVAVFDFYNTLTSNGGGVNTNDAGQESGNHHRWQNNAVQHIHTAGNNFSAYGSGDSHPTGAGGQKAAAEFVPLLNVYYHRWQGSAGAAPPAPTETPQEEPATEALPTPTEAPQEEQATAAPPAPTQSPQEEQPAEASNAELMDDFESGAEYWGDAEQGSSVECSVDSGESYNGDFALRMQYTLAPDGWVDCGRSFDKLRNWGASEGISVWLYADGSARWMSLIFFSGDPDAPTPFEAGIELPVETVGEWTQIALPWENFTRAEWASEDGLSEIDLARIIGYGFSLGNDEDAAGVLWVDELYAPVALPSVAPIAVATPDEAPAEATPPAAVAPSPTVAEDEPAPEEPTPLPPTQTPDDETPSVETPDENKEAESGGGICGLALLPLAGLGVLLTGRKRKKQ